MGKCVGTLGKRPDTCSVCEHHEERAIQDGSHHYCRHPDSYLLEWSNNIYDNSPFGNGISAEYGVHQDCPIDTNTTYPYSTSWAFAGPLMEAGRISVQQKHDGWWAACVYDVNDDGHYYQLSRSFLVAAMRCYVESKCGKTIEIPEIVYETNT